LSVFVLAVIAVLAGAGAAEGQRPNLGESADRVRAALQASAPTLKIPLLPLRDPNVRRFGIVTLLPPDTNGEFVRAVVPVGTLAMRAGRAVAVAHHRRAERDAHEAVLRVLQDYLAAR